MGNPNADFVYLICGITFLFIGIVAIYVSMIVKEKEKKKEK